MAPRLNAATLADAAQQPGHAPGALGPVVSQIPIAGLVRHPRNARTIQPTPEQTAALAASVRATGVLVPVMVARMDDGRIGVLAGWQRVSAARASGIDTVPAIRVEATEAANARLSLIENALRADMHPVDQWRAVDALMAGGASLKHATATLGLSDREAGQMRLLAGLHPDLLAEMASGVVPSEHVLREIVRAPLPRQAEVLAACTIGSGASRRIDWHSISAACRVTRISRKRAIFAVKDSGVVFERDLFAEPGSDEEWTTTDVAGFLDAQEAAMTRLVDGHERAAVYPWNANGYAPVVPLHWRQVQWLDKVPKEVPELPPDRRFAISMMRDGQVACRVYLVPADEPAAAEDRPAAEAERAPPRLMTDAGLQMAAQMRHQALRDALEAMTDSWDSEHPAILLRVLLECLAAQNVTPGAADKHAALEAIADATPEGGEPHAGRLVKIAIETIAAILVFPAPKMMSSGPVAEQIAASLGAERHLPRCDTPEFLAQCSGALLREAARLVERQPGMKVPNGVGVLREWLVGKLPDWRPISFQGDSVDA